MPTAPMRVFRREDIAHVRVVARPGDAPVVLEVIHVDLYFFFDVDVVLLNVELGANDLTLDQAQEQLYRFGRGYPAGWDAPARRCTPPPASSGSMRTARCSSAPIRSTASLHGACRRAPRAAHRGALGLPAASRWWPTIPTSRATCATARSSTTACR